MDNYLINISKEFERLNNLLESVIVKEDGVKCVRVSSRMFGGVDFAKGKDETVEAGVKEEDKEKPKDETKGKVDTEQKPDVEPVEEKKEEKVMTTETAPTTQ